MIHLHLLALITPLLSLASSLPPDVMAVLIFTAFLKCGFTTNACKLKLAVYALESGIMPMCGFLKLSVFIQHCFARFIHVITYIVFYSITDCICPFSQ